MSDARDRAAEAAFPETEYAQRATILAFRSAFTTGWDAAVSETATGYPDRETLINLLQSRYQDEATGLWMTGLLDADEMADAILALFPPPTSKEN